MQHVELRLAALERQLRRTRLLSVCLLAAVLLLAGAAASQKPADQMKVKSLSAEDISTQGITVRDAQGRPRVALRVGKDGAPFVSLLDEATKVRLLLSLQENQHPLVQFSNANEEPQMNLFYNKNLGSAITMQSAAGRALYAVPTGGAPRVELGDGTGKTLFQAP